MPLTPYNSNRAIRILIISLAFYFFYAGATYYFMQRNLQSGFRFNTGALLVPAMLLVDIGVYRWLRHQYIHARYARIHLWSVICMMIFLPAISALITFLLITHADLPLPAGMLVTISFLCTWAGILFFIAGHIALILLIAGRNQRQAEAGNAGDHLHEFEQ